MEKDFKIKQFVIITLITSIWIHIGEFSRALCVAFPRMKAFFKDKMVLEEMQLSNLLIWLGWDMLLTIILVFIFWLCAQVFGNNQKAIIISSTTTCLSTLGIYWIATVNSGLGDWTTAAILILIAWVELVIGALIASKLYSRKV